MMGKSDQVRSSKYFFINFLRNKIDVGVLAATVREF